MILAMKSRQQCLLTSRICLFEAQRLLSTSKFYVRQAARPNFNLMMPYQVEVEVKVVEETHANSGKAMRLPIFFAM